MVFRSILSGLLVLTGLALFLSTGGSHAQSPTIISGKFYKLDVIAASNEAPLTSVLAAPSINDNGVVSFIGQTTGGQNHVFISTALGSYSSVNTGTNLPLANNSQINNSK
jgi:hypothetical protein